jgi:hypothetical protein
LEHSQVSKPVILTVDDDPAVLGAIERDLRRQCRAEYRVMKAASATAGLDSGPGRTEFQVRLRPAK